jgi:hypothetical protein
VRVRKAIPGRRKANEQDFSIVTTTEAGEVGACCISNRKRKGGLELPVVDSQQLPCLIPSTLRTTYTVRIYRPLE